MNRGKIPVLSLVKGCLYEGSAEDTFIGFMYLETNEIRGGIHGIYAVSADDTSNHGSKPDFAVFSSVT